MDRECYGPSLLWAEMSLNRKKYRLFPTTKYCYVLILVMNTLLMAQNPWSNSLLCLSIKICSKL